MRCGRGQLLAVCMAQGRHMVTHHQDKFNTAFGQCAALHATAGTAQQLKRILWRARVRVFGPFLRSQAHRPMRFKFQFNIQPGISAPLSPSRRTAAKTTHPTSSAVYPQNVGSRLWISSGATPGNPHPPWFFQGCLNDRQMSFPRPVANPSFTCYNDLHCHSTIGHITPDMVHYICAGPYVASDRSLWKRHFLPHPIASKA